MQATTEAKRLPEGTALAWHRAHVLHANVRSPALAVPPDHFRSRAANDAAVARLEPALKEQLMRVAEEINDGKERTELLRLAGLDAFFAQSAAVKRAALARIGARGGAKSSEMRALLESEVLAGLDERAIVALIEGTGRCATSILINIAKNKSFRALSAIEQVELIKYAVGPELLTDVPSMRRNRLALGWHTHRADLMRALLVARDADAIREFFHSPTRVVYFLDATALNGHAAIVFGDPADPRSPSYGRRWMLGADSRPLARLFSPDPTVCSGWKKPSSDALTVYAFTSYAISRRDEQALIEWIERSQPIEEKTVKTVVLGPTRVARDRAGFTQQALKVLSTLTRGRKSERASGYMRAGRACEQPRAAAAV